MAIIEISKFEGLVPRVEPKRLPAEVSQVCVNCDTRRGNLEPLDNTLASATLAGAAKTAYYFNSAWLYWDAAVHVVKAFLGTAGDEDNPKRIWYTGDGVPKQRDTAGNIRRLGFAGPSVNLTWNLAGTNNGGVRTTTAYRYTYISTWGEESQPDSEPVLADIYNNNTSNTLSGFANIHAADALVDIEYVRLYRLVTGASGVAEYYQVGSDVTIATAIASGVTDTLAADDTNINFDVPLITEDWGPPPATMAGLTLYINNILLGFVGKKLYASEPGYPYAWPHSFDLESDIKAIGMVGGSAVVVTESRPYVFTGLDPTTFVKKPLPYNRPCSSTYGGAETENGYAYPCPDGMFLLTDAGGQLITEMLFTKEQWNAYTIANMIVRYDNNTIYCFFAGAATGFFIPLTEAPRVHSFDLGTLLVQGALVDGTDLYAVCKVGSTYTVQKWEAGSGSLSYQWRSKDFYFPVETYFQIGRCVIESGSVTINIYVDDVLQVTQAVSTEADFYALTGFGKKFEIDLTGTGVVDYLILGETVEDINKGVGI